MHLTVKKGMIIITNIKNICSDLPKGGCECRKEMGYSQETLAAMLYMKKTTICKYEKDLHDIPSSVLVELAKALHTTPNYLLLGDVEADDWMDDMIQMLEKIKRPEHRELAKKQIALLVQPGDS